MANPASTSLTKQLWLPVGVALVALTPGLILRMTGYAVSPVASTAVFGVAILAAGFLLSWGAEGAENAISQGLILALVAIVTVLPEYAVDIYYAFKAGQDPKGGYVAYAAANMTGANRMLIGLAWPAMVLLNWWKTRKRVVELGPESTAEVAFLGLASLYAFVVLLKNSISLVDTGVLVSLFGVYLWRVSRGGSSESAAMSEEEDEEEPGPGSAIAKFKPGLKWAMLGGLTLVAAASILAVAEPFAESMIRAGEALNVDRFLLIQWLAPIASEAPAIVIAMLFVLAGKAGDGLIAMISDKINQWTLLVGMLPLAMTVGAGTLTGLPLDARQHEEFFLTAAQSLFGLGLLLRLRLSVPGAAALGVLFLAQILTAFALRGDEARDIAALTWIAWGYLALAGALFLRNWRPLLDVVRTSISGRPAAPAAARSRV